MGKWLIDSDGNAYNELGNVIAPFYDRERDGFIVYLWFPQYDLYDSVSPYNEPIASIEEARAFIRGYVQGYNDKINEELSTCS